MTAARKKLPGPTDLLPTLSTREELERGWNAHQADCVRCRDGQVCKEGGMFRRAMKRALPRAAARVQQLDPDLSSVEALYRAWNDHRADCSGCRSGGNHGRRCAEGQLLLDRWKQEARRQAQPQIKAWARRHVARAIREVRAQGRFGLVHDPPPDNVSGFDCYTAAGVELDALALELEAAADEIERAAKKP